MESHGLPGSIQESAATHERLRQTFRFEERGTVEIKGRDPMPTWLLIGRATVGPPARQGSVDGT